MDGFPGDMGILVDALPLECGVAPDIESCCQAKLREALFTTIRSMGFLYVRFSCWLKEASNNGEYADSFSINFSNFPAAWELHYEQNAYYLVDPVLEKLAQAATERLVYGTWHDAMASSLSAEAELEKEDRILRLMNDISLHGIHSGCFMMYNTGLKRLVISIASDWSPEKLQQHVSDHETFNRIFAVIAILANGMMLAEHCQHYQMAIRVSGTAPVKLTARQREVLTSFLENAKANNRSVARMHHLSTESISFHLKDIRRRLNKPGASGHALATIAKSHGLI